MSNSEVLLKLPLDGSNGHLENGTNSRKRSEISSIKPEVKKKKSNKENLANELMPDLRISRRLQDKAHKQIEDDKEKDNNVDSLDPQVGSDEEPNSPIIPSKRRKSKDKSKVPPKNEESSKLGHNRRPNGGLTNLGNTCFMNAVLQALFGLPVFVSALKSFLAEVKDRSEEGSLLNAVNKLITTTETENREKALNDLRNIIVQKHEIFDNFDMHDAQEFLQILLQNLAAECNLLRSDSNDILECPISKTFRVSFQHTRTCTKCCLEQDAPEEFDYSFSLTVPDSPSSVQSCISTFFNTSTIQKTCSACAQNIDHHQRTKISKLPRVLIVHFQRLAPKFDEKTRQFQSDKKSLPIELSSSISLKYVVQQETKIDPKLNKNEIKYGLESIEQMKQWENRLKGDQGSTMVIEDNKKMLNLGPRAIKQLTEEQQLKLAMARSMQEDEDYPDDTEIDEELDSQIDYINISESGLLKDNAMLGVAQDPILPESYSLLATVNHHGTQADTGHYTADVLNPSSQKWTSFNDSRVRTILEKTVKGRKKICYLLFYMRKEFGLQLISEYQKKQKADESQ